MVAKVDILVLGGTGLLGSRISNVARDAGLTAIASSRSSKVAKINALNFETISDVIDIYSPRVVINCLAMLDCEADEAQGYLMNAKLPWALSQYCATKGISFVHISTDAFYKSVDNNAAEFHNALSFPSAYARTKYAGEQFLNSKSDLVIRTTFLGRRMHGPPSLLDFLIDGITAQRRLDIYEDMYTSSIDVFSCATIILRLIEMKLTGCFNLGTHTAYTKAELYRCLCIYLDIEFNAESVYLQALKHTTSNRQNGMNVSKLEKALGFKMPDLDTVIRNLAKNGEI
jgi:dTDP-4-dehydrorhamnose reductase